MIIAEEVYLLLNFLIRDHYVTGDKGLDQPSDKEGVLISVNAFLHMRVLIQALPTSFYRDRLVPQEI